MRRSWRRSRSRSQARARRRRRNRSKRTKRNKRKAARPRGGNLENPQPEELNIFFVWVGERPDDKYLAQIKKAIDTAKFHNPRHKIWLYSNLIRGDEVSCTVKSINLVDLFADSPASALKMGPRGECPEGWESIPPRNWSDLFRMVVLWKYGGSYVDVDDVFIRPIPKGRNIFAAGAIQTDAQLEEYKGGISGQYLQDIKTYTWRFGNDPMINVAPGNPFLKEIMSRLHKNPIGLWGQILPTQIFKENPSEWRLSVTPTPWHDLLYHPFHDGHTDYDQRYGGDKIKCSDPPSAVACRTILGNYNFCIVKNHNFQSDTGHTILAALLNTSGTYSK